MLTANITYLENKSCVEKQPILQMERDLILEEGIIGVLLYSYSRNTQYTEEMGSDIPRLLLHPVDIHIVYFPGIIYPRPLLTEED